VGVTGTGGDIRDVGVRGVEVVGVLSDGILPSISLNAGSAGGDSGGVRRGAGGGSALGDGAVVIDGTGSTAVVLLDALNEVELLEFVGDDVESASLNLIPFAFSGTVLAAECVGCDRACCTSISIGIEGNVGHVEESGSSESLFETTLDS